MQLLTHHLLIFSSVILFFYSNLLQTGLHLDLPPQPEANGFLGFPVFREASCLMIQIRLFSG